MDPVCAKNLLPDLKEESNFRDVFNEDGWVILEIFPQFGDVNIQASSRKIVTSPPNLLQNILLFNDLSTILDQEQ